MRATGLISNTISNFSGSLDELKQLDPSIYLDSSYLHMAIDRNDVEMVKWLLQKNCLTTKFAHEYAAKNGNLEIIKLLIEYGQYYSYYAIAYSSKYIDCFKYYFEHYCTNNTNDVDVDKEKVKVYERKRIQEFWNEEYVINEELFDLDDPVWRKLFNFNLRNYTKLQEKIDIKKKQIEDCKVSSMKLLKTYIPIDVIQYCLYPYF